MPNYFYASERKKKITGTKIKERKFYENFSLDRVVLYENLSVLYYFLDGREIRAGKIERMDERGEARDPEPGGGGRGRIHRDRLPCTFFMVNR